MALSKNIENMHFMAIKNVHSSMLFYFFGYLLCMFYLYSNRIYPCAADLIYCQILEASTTYDSNSSSIPDLMQFTWSVKISEVYNFLLVWLVIFQCIQNKIATAKQYKSDSNF